MNTLLIFSAISILICLIQKKFADAGLTALMVILGLLATLPSGWGWTVLFVFLFASFAAEPIKKCSPCGFIALAIAMILIPIRLEWEGFIAIVSWGFGLWAVVVSFFKD